MWLWRLRSPLLNVVQVLFPLAWSVFWISLSGLLVLLTRDGEVALMMARRCRSTCAR